jgi:acetyl-CoA acetyltransferase
VPLRQLAPSAVRAVLQPGATRRHMWADGLFDTDEHVRGSVTLEQLATMKPAFSKDGLVTPVTSSGINDGAAAVLLAEAFAAQACAVMRELDLDPAKVNPNGSGISLGHPVGATGAIITVKALHELQRIGGRYALVTMCIGGGQGIAAIFERV